MKLAMSVFIAGLLSFSGDIMKREPLVMTVVYDNNAFDPRLTTEWGFSCWITVLDKTIVFDTGSDGEVLLSNMQRLGLDPKSIDMIFISHDHYDHTGGLESLLHENPSVQVFTLSSFSDTLKNRVRTYGAQLVEQDSLTMLLPLVYTTGQLGTEIKEQSLVLKTEKGLVVVTGCAHPGISRILQYVKQHFDEEIHMVLGGFHLGGATDDVLRSVITRLRELGIQKIGPCHCSGDRCRELFRDEYKKNYQSIGVGAVIQIE